MSKNLKKNRTCIYCGFQGKWDYFWNNSNICMSCIANKKQKTKDIKNKLLASQEVTQYIYMMFDKDDNIVYVGQTENMDRRMKSHCIFVSQEEIDVSLSSKYENVIIPSDHLADIKRVKYAKVPNKYFSSIYEIQLIAKFLPIYNTQYKYYTNELIDLPELTWDYYVPYSYYEGLTLEAGMKYRLNPSKELNKMGRNFETRKQAMKILSKLMSQERIKNKQETISVG